jgi:hypothetical protein
MFGKLVSVGDDGLEVAEDFALGEEGAVFGVEDVEPV